MIKSRLAIQGDTMASFSKKITCLMSMMGVFMTVVNSDAQVAAYRDVAIQVAGVQVASVEDATRSTGATLFYFPSGAAAQVDVRGGSAATSETHLIEPGSYSNIIDGIVFAGGSTMGLAAADGVREAIFKSRSGNAADFNSIPSVPSAVIYDFSARNAPGQDKLVYPNREMGLELMKRLSAKNFRAGRAGAGLSATANKVSQKIWGGQGIAIKDLGHSKVVAAVILNPVGNVNVKGIKPISDATPFVAPQAGTNTTLSIVIVEAKLNNEQLRRLAMSTHTSMARMIYPFHTFYDGDTHFAISTKAKDLPTGGGDKDYFFEIMMAASDAMAEAIEMTATISNQAN